MGADVDVVVSVESGAVSYGADTVLAGVVVCLGPNSSLLD